MFKEKKKLCVKELIFFFKINKKTSTADNDHIVTNYDSKSTRGGWKWTDSNKLNKSMQILLDGPIQICGQWAVFNWYKRRFPYNLSHKFHRTVPPPRDQHLFRFQRLEIGVPKMANGPRGWQKVRCQTDTPRSLQPSIKSISPREFS